MSCPKSASLRKFMSSYDKVHDTYCQDIDKHINCNVAEGCKYIDEPKDGLKKCRLNTDIDLGNVYISGGIGFGKLCLDNKFVRLIIMILYPPLYIFLEEKRKTPRFTNIKAIIMNFVFTCMFYFPGLIHALHYFFTEGNPCSPT